MAVGEHDTQTVKERNGVQNAAKDLLVGALMSIICWSISIPLSQHSTVVMRGHVDRQLPNR